MAALLPIVVRPLPLRVKPYAIQAYWHESRDGDGAHRWFRERVAQIVREAATGEAGAVGEDEDEAG